MTFLVAPGGCGCESLRGGESSPPSCPELRVLRLLISSPFRFLIDGQASGWCSQGCQAIVDTGTSLLTVPQQYLSAVQQATGAQVDQYGQVCRGGGVPSLGEASGRQLRLLLGSRNSLILGLHISGFSRHWSGEPGVTGWGLEPASGGSACAAGL